MARRARRRTDRDDEVDVPSLCNLIGRRARLTLRPPTALRVVPRPAGPRRGRNSRAAAMTVAGRRALGSRLGYCLRGLGDLATGLLTYVRIGVMVPHVFKLIECPLVADGAA